MIAVVIPTIAGREDLLERTIAAYRGNTWSPVKVIVVRDRPTVGEAWNDGAAAAGDADFLHLSADDVLPAPRWDEAAIGCAAAGVYPSPRIVNVDGSLHSCGTLGAGMLLPDCADMTPCGSSPFPFLAAGDWRRVGPALPVHYFADDHLAWRARCAGLLPMVCRGYQLTHLEGTIGRRRLVDRAAADRAEFLAAVAVQSPVLHEVAL